MDAFYLKINRSESYALKNLSRWIDASYLLRADCYVVCDNPDLIKKIKKDLLIYRNIVFLESEKNKEISYIVNNIANRNWINAAYAHLTTFWHAKGKYTHFWNIDADDTRFCLSIDRMAEALKEVQEVAKGNKIDCFSLDMWRSETYGKHWSFGVTYVDNTRTDWIRLCRDKCLDEEYFLMEKEGNCNIDWFYTYLKSSTNKKIETFYFENLKFIHYSNDFIERPIGSGIYHWYEGKLTYPILRYGMGMKEIGEFDIAHDVVRFDIGITDKECSEIMTYYAREGKDIDGYYTIDNIVNLEICQLKFNKFIEKHGYSKTNSPEIICFGAGNGLEKNLKKINRIARVHYVCDNDENKWGKVFNGIKCISPDELAKVDKVIVVIFVLSYRIAEQIAKQLSDMDVEYDYIDNWLACVE